MSETQTVNDPNNTPVPEQTPEPAEQIYEFQPTDEEGRPLGGPQVFKYKTQEELLQKITKANVELIKLSRKLNKDLRLGNIVQDQIPADAPRFDESKFVLNAEPLTAEERISLVQEINDPENFDKAANRIVRATIGDPEALRTRLARLEEKAAKQSALEEAESFRRATPEYYVCPENFATLANWMIKNGLEPVKENFQRAYDAVGDFLIAKPIPKAEQPVLAPVVETPPPAQTPRPAKPGAFGLSNDISSSVGPPPAKTGYTAEEIDKMTAEEYKQKILIPDWKKLRQQPQTI